MAKWFGKVGYAETVETKPGVFKEISTARPYYGDLIEVDRKLQSSGQVNDNITISNRISIVADPYAVGHMFAIRYAEYEGAKWKVTSVKSQRPRLILTLGGLYNGK